VTLTVTRGGVQETFELKLGHLDPYDTISGLQQRLNNLGFACGDPTGEMNEGTKLAMRSFMAKRRPDETTDGQEQVQSFIRDEYGY
jgi:peptidoglycan hydrolase-like protein with peptidoglycan-binding domain